MLALRLNGSHPIHNVTSDARRLLDVAFEGFPRMAFGTRSSHAFPAINVWEDAERLHIEAELPGLRLEELEILLAGDALTIQGERRSEQDEEATRHRVERMTGSFRRVVQLPFEVDADAVEATLRDGVLQLMLPKSARVKARRVPVKASQA